MDSSTLTGAYQAIGAPLIHNCFLIKFINEAGNDITISTNGITDMDLCPAENFFLYDESANASREGGLSIARGTQFYIKGTASTGPIYLVAQYIAN
jgi:hypothetical protein